MTTAINSIVTNTTPTNPTDPPTTKKPKKREVKQDSKKSDRVAALMKARDQQLYPEDFNDKGDRVADAKEDEKEEEEQLNEEEIRMFRKFV